MTRKQHLVATERQLYSMADEIRESAEGPYLFCPIGGDGKDGYGGMVERAFDRRGVDYVRFNLTDKSGYVWEDEEAGHGYKRVKSSRGRNFMRAIEDNNIAHILLFDNTVESLRTMVGAHVFVLEHLLAERYTSGDIDVRSAVITDPLGAPTFCVTPVYEERGMSYRGMKALMTELVPDTFAYFEEHGMTDLITDRSSLERQVEIRPPVHPLSYLPGGDSGHGDFVRRIREESVSSLPSVPEVRNTGTNGGSYEMGSRKSESGQENGEQGTRRERRDRGGRKLGELRIPKPRSREF